MELNIARDVETNIEGAVQFGTTNNSAKLFSMLSNMLYKNKERSVLTELSSNAIDAHKLVGKEDTPIEVTMPTTLSPEIRIRDFGPGLSHENVIRFLTTYGESDKQKSNDFIGGYGIGSKSPASVTDTWSIHSHHDGVHRQYLVFISGEGVPSLTKILEKPTSETGLEVIVPVKTHSFGSWNNACAETFKFYPLRPKFFNFQNSHMMNLNYIYDGQSFKLFTSSSNVNVSAIINHRQYPLDVSKILEGTSIPTMHQNILKLKNINIMFNIGELSLSLSREDLQYDQKTINAIRAKLPLVYDELNALYTVEVLDKGESELHMFTLATKFFEKYIKNDYYGQSHQEYYRAFSVGHKFYSTTLKMGQTTIDIDFPFDINAKFLNRGSDRIIGAKNPRSNFAKYHRPSAYAANKQYTLQLNIRGIEDVVFLINDASHINMRTVQSYGNIKNVVIGEDFSLLPEFLKKNIIKASSLPKPNIQRTKKDKSDKIDSNFYRVTGRQLELTKDTHFTDKVAAGEKIAYVTFTNATTTSSIVELDAYNQLIEFGFYNQIVAVKVGTDVPKWAVKPEVLLKGLYDSLLPDYNKISVSSFIGNIKNQPALNQLVLHKPIRTTAKNTLWNELLDEISSIDMRKLLGSGQSSAISIRIGKLEKALGIQTPVQKSKYDNWIATILEAYPLLKVLDRTTTLTAKETHDNIMKYIESCGV
jgi:hypothetical protein